MAPHSKSNMGSEIDLSKISEKLEKITLEEESTYVIEDTDDEDESATPTSTIEVEENLCLKLKDCTEIKEKGPIPPEKINNNRVTQYQRPQSQSQNNNLNNIYEYDFPLLNGLNGINDNFLKQLIQELDNPESPESSESTSSSFSGFSGSPPNYNLLEYENIPEPVLVLNIPPIPPYQSTIAENQLSDVINQNKSLKQKIWILVNKEDEYTLISKLKSRIMCQRFNLTDLHYLYVIFIRLLKDDARPLLIDYLSNNDVLSEIAVKQNVLLMNFLLEVHQNLNININQVNLLNKIINLRSLDLTEIFNALINYKYNDGYVIDIDCVDQEGNTILMNLLRNIGNGIHGNPLVYDNYLSVVLGRYPRITQLSNDGKNIFHHAYEWRCSPHIVSQICAYYDPFVVNDLMAKRDQKYV